MTDTQRQLLHCTAPCYPVDCPSNPFGAMDMTMEEIQRKYLGGFEDVD